MSIVNVEALKSNGCQLWWTGAVASANSPKAITANGDVKQLLPFPGAGIGMFDGTGDYIRFTSTIDFAVSTWTVKFKIYPKSLATGQIIFGGSTSGTPVILIADGGAGLIALGKIGSETIIGSALTINTWNDITVTKNNLTITIYKNGVQVGQGTIASNFTNPSIVSVAAYSNGNVPFNGYISELKFQTGIDITPIPNKQLESDSNTKLLIHFNRNDTTFIDSSPSAHTITSYGNAKQLCSPCGSGVAYFDGNGDYLTNIVPENWNFLHNGTTPFTVSFWYHSGSASTNRILYTGTTSRASNEFVIQILSTGLVRGVIHRGVSSTEALIIDSTSAIIFNSWNYIVVRVDMSLASNNIEFYINGLPAGTGNKTAYSVSTGNCVGLYFGTSVNGYVAELKISTNWDLYTVPTTPFIPDSYTKLLLHMDGTGNAFYDSSDPPGDNGFPILPDGVTVTPNGTFAVEKMKDGRNIWKFDGSTNYITISDHTSWSMFTNDFTIVGWVKFDSIAADRIIIGQYVDVGNCWYVKWTPTGNLVQLAGVTSSISKFDYACTLVPVVGTWYHIAVQRKDSNCLMFINSISQSVFQSMPFSTSVVDIAAALSIGKLGTEYQAGNTKDLQIFHKALTQDQIAAIMAETYIY